MGDLLQCRLDLRGNRIHPNVLHQHVLSLMLDLQENERQPDPFLQNMLGNIQKGSEQLDVNAVANVLEGILTTNMNCQKIRILAFKSINVDEEMLQHFNLCDELRAILRKITNDTCDELGEQSDFINTIRDLFRQIVEYLGLFQPAPNTPKVSALPSLFRTDPSEFVENHCGSILDDLDEALNTAQGVVGPLS